MILQIYSDFLYISKQWMRVLLYLSVTD